MADFADDYGRFEIGRVISRTFGLFGAGIGRLTLAVLIVIQLLGVIFQFRILQGSSIALFENGLVVFALGVPLFLAFIAFYILFSAMVTRGAIHELIGRDVSWQDELSAATRKFLPLIGLAILQGLAIFVGFLFLVIPGIILAVIWCVTQQTLLVENRPVMDTFQRSRDLTRGYRWHIVGLYVVYVIGAIILGVILGIVQAVMGALAGTIAASVIAGITQGINASVALLGSAALYVELRQAKDGFGNETADLFE